MTDPLDDRLRDLLTPVAPATRPPLDTVQRLVVRARRRRRRRALLGTGLSIAIVGTAALAAPSVVPRPAPDVVTFADSPSPSPSDAPSPSPSRAPSADPAATAGPDTRTGPTPAPGPPARLVASTAGGRHAVVVYDVSGPARPLRELSSAEEDLILTGTSPDGRTAYTQSLEVEGCGRYNAVLPTDGSGRGGPLWHDDPGWPFAALSPDGTRIAALERPADSGSDSRVCEGDGPWDLVVVDTATGATRRWGNASLGGMVGIDLAWSPDGRAVAFQRYTPDRGVSGQLVVLDVTGPGGDADEAVRLTTDCAARSPQWRDAERVAFLEVCPDGTSTLVLVSPDGGGDGVPAVPERRGLPRHEAGTYGPQDLDLDASGRWAVWAEANRLYALDLVPVDAEVRDLGIEGISPQW